MSLIRRRMMLVEKKTDSFDIADPDYWMAGTVGGDGKVIPGTEYNHIILKDARTDLYGKSVSYSSGYEIYAFYYNNADGTGNGRGSSWSSSNPFQIGQSGLSVRLLFRPSNNPEDIRTLINPELI